MPIGPPWSTWTCRENDSGRNENFGYASPEPVENQSGELLAVGNPYILDLGGVLEKPASFSNLRIEPVDRAAFVSPYLFQVSRGHRLGGGDGSLVPIAPDGIDIIMFRERLEQLRNISGHNVYRASGEIARVEELIEIARDQGILFGRYRDHRVSDRNQRQH